MVTVRKGQPIVDLRPRPQASPRRTSPRRDAKAVSPSSSTGPFVSRKRRRTSPTTRGLSKSSPESHHKDTTRPKPSWEAQWSFETPRREYHKLKIDQSASYTKSLATSKEAFDSILHTTGCSRAIALCALLKTNGLVEDAITLILSKDYNE